MYIYLILYIYLGDMYMSKDIAEHKFQKSEILAKAYGIAFEKPRSGLETSILAGSKNSGSYSEIFKDESFFNRVSKYNKKGKLVHKGWRNDKFISKADGLISYIELLTDLTRDDIKQLKILLNDDQFRKFCSIDTGIKDYLDVLNRLCILFIGRYFTREADKINRNEHNRDKYLELDGTFIPEVPIMSVNTNQKLRDDLKNKVDKLDQKFLKKMAFLHRESVDRLGYLKSGFLYSESKKI